MSPWLVAALALALFTLSPGPDTAVVTRAALSGGTAHGIRTASGIVTGVLTWGLLTVAGLAAVLAASATAYTVVKLLGAAYLVWLGVRTLWHARLGDRGPSPLAEHRPLPGGAWRTGFLSNILNPKVAVFYTGLLPQLVPPGAPEVPSLAALALLHVTLSVVWLGVYAAGVARLAGLLRRPRVRRAIDALSGLVLVGFGARIVATVRR